MAGTGAGVLDDMAAGLASRIDSGNEVSALIMTSWHVTEAAKTTRITYQSGAHLVLDYTAVAGTSLPTTAASGYAAVITVCALLTTAMCDG